MSVSSRIQIGLSVEETLETNVPAASSGKRKITHDQFNKDLTLNATSTPPATKVAPFNQVMTAGAATLTLSSLLGTNGVTVDGSGLRIQQILLRAPAANANPVVIKKGVTNGYVGFGANFSLELAPGAHAAILTNGNGAVISGTNLTLDLVGTLAQSLDVQIVLG